MLSADDGRTNNVLKRGLPIFVNANITSAPEKKTKHAATKPIFCLCSDIIDYLI
jgi:hypothetical protein